MDLFLAIKQIVDLLYQFKILDYAIFICAICLFVYFTWKEKIYNIFLSISEFRQHLVITDVIVFFLCISYLCTFIRHPENSYNQFVKTISAFFMYFLGRVCGKYILKDKRPLLFVSYLVIYLNLFFRIYQYIRIQQGYDYGGFDFVVLGGLYYYKTDLLIALIIATIFIYALDDNKGLKYFTIIFVVSILAFTTTARMGQLVLLIEYALILILEIRKKAKSKWHISIILLNVIGIVVIACSVILFVVLQMSLIKTTLYENLAIPDALYYKIENLFHSRQIIWWNSMNYFTNQNIITRMIGIDLWSESTRSFTGTRFHCYYLKLIYSVGYIGFMLFIMFVVFLAKEIRKRSGYTIKYITIALWIMFVLISISMESIEYTQMSWYPFIFAGAIMSKGEKVNE